MACGSSDVVRFQLLARLQDPTGGWTYYFCFFRCLPSAIQRPPSVATLGFQLFQGKVFIPIFTKFGMGVYWVNSLYRIAFGEDSCIAN